MKVFASKPVSAANLTPLSLKVFQAVMIVLLLGTIILASQTAFGQVTAPVPADTAPQYAPGAPISAPSATSALKVDSSTQRVPAGTMLTIAFNTPLDSKTTVEGTPFSATLAQDFAYPGLNGGRRIILPAGTIVRGRVDKVKKPGFFSAGGSIALSFDHVMLPSGELLPLSLNLSTENTTVNKSGALYMDPGIGKKVAKGVEQGKGTFTDITEKGWEAGRNIGGGLGSIVTVPAAVIGGAVAGAGVTAGKAAVAVVGKGETAAIKPGDTVTIDFGGSFNLPAEE